MGTDFCVDLVTQRRPTGKGLGLAVVEAKGQLQPLCTWEDRVGGFSGHFFLSHFCGLAVGYDRCGYTTDLDMQNVSTG